MKHNSIADVVKPRWFLKIVLSKFSRIQFAFFYVQIAEGATSKIFTCKLCSWVKAVPSTGAVLKDCYDVLLPVSTRIVNLPLYIATVPMKLKEAAITAIIKKESLDHDLYQL